VGTRQGGAVAARYELRTSDQSMETSVSGSKVTFSEVFDRVTRPESRAFKAYHVAQDRGFARMHQNEGVLPLSAAARNELAREFADVLAQDWGTADGGVNVYPQLVPYELRQSYADYLGVPVSCVEVFPGSSDALQTIAAGCFRRGARVAFLEPSFSILHEMVSFWGAEYVPILLDNQFNISRESLFSDAILNADVVILCTPNNPTGALIPQEYVEEFIERASGLVVIDEAYFEFAKVWNESHCDFLVQAQGKENVLLLRTLSKAWGAAGLRVGALVGSPQWVDFFSRLKHPYAVSRPSELLGSYILNQKRDLMRQIVQHAVQSCRLIIEELEKMRANDKNGGLCVYPTRANFVLIESPHAAQIARVCHSKGVLVRFLELRNASFVRISPWSQDSTLIFLDVTRSFHKGD
jgi:histidinol-phosphate aminotransferase